MRNQSPPAAPDEVEGNASVNGEAKAVRPDDGARTAQASLLSTWQVVAWVAVGVTLVALPVVQSGFALVVLMKIMYWGLFATALNITAGYGGMHSLGHSVFFGAGALLAAQSFAQPLSVVPVLLLAVLACGVLGIGFGLLSIRRSEVYFVMITLALAGLVYEVGFQWRSVTGGYDGRFVPAATLVPGGTSLDRVGTYRVLVVVFLLSMFALWVLMRTPLRSVLFGIQSSMPRMRALGYPVKRLQLNAVVLSAVFAGVAGVMAAYGDRFVSARFLQWEIGALALIYVIIGGEGRFWGPVLAVALFVGLEQTTGAVTAYWHIVLGALMILVLLFGRAGIAGTATAFTSRRLSSRMSRRRV